ncbi:MAG: biopolymer transporter ExbD [Proteobacteria bacterium]|nr:biopolymer transporter ExbD [Pseudomonadota bacterium]MBU1640559.1 biopolymer transporter ExbD [Pseudomonadota bacterium]
MRLDHKSLAPPRIEMLPLIDVVFLLLVFFIYAMLSMAVHHGQAVALPQSTSAALEAQQAISISIQAVDQGMILFVDEEPVNLELLSERLRNKKADKQAGQDPEVQIFADKAVFYQQLFQVLDRVREAGLVRISLQTVAKATAP